MAKFNLKDISPRVDGRFYYGWLMLLVGFLFMAIPLAIKSNASSLFLIPICEEFGVSRTVYVQTNTVMTVCMLIGSSFMGKVLSKFKMRRVLPLLLAGVSVTYILMGRTHAMWQLLVLSGIQGLLWAGSTNLPVNILISNWFGPKIKGTCMSLAFAGTGVGGLIWVPIVKAAMNASNWRTAYLVMAAGVAIMIPITFFLCVNLPDEKGYSRRVGDPSLEEIQASGGVSMTKRGITGPQALKTARWWCQFAAVLMGQIVITGFTSQCVAYFSDLGVENGAAIYAAAIGTLTFGKILLGLFSDVVGIKRAVVIAPILGSIAFISLAMCSQNMAWSTGVIIGYMVAGSLSIFIALVTPRNFGEKDYGTMAGWMNMSGNLGQIFGPIIVAAVFDITGTYVRAWWFLAAVCFVMALLYYLSTILNKKQLQELGYDPEV